MSNQMQTMVPGYYTRLFAYAGCAIHMHIWIAHGFHAEADVRAAKSIDSRNTFWCYVTHADGHRICLKIQRHGASDDLEG
jgi:hypothetical protein